MRRVLLIDDDYSYSCLPSAARLQGLEIVWARSGADGVRLASEVNADIVFIDLDLGSVSGLEVLKQLRSTVPSTPCIMVSDSGSMSDAIQAMRLGAVDWLQIPLTEQVLLDALRTIQAKRVVRQSEVRGEEAELHPLVRWAGVVVRALESARDPRTLGELGRSIGVSVGTIRNWCYRAELPARETLQLARALRVMIKSRCVVVEAKDLFDIVDRRTLRKVLLACGGTDTALPESVDEFLERQSFIRSPKAIRELRAALERRPIPAINALPS